MNLANVISSSNKLYICVCKINKLKREELLSYSMSVSSYKKKKKKKKKKSTL